MKKLVLVAITLAVGVICWLVFHTSAPSRTDDSVLSDARDASAPATTSAPETATPPARHAAPGLSRSTTIPNPGSAAETPPSAERAHALVAGITETIFNRSSFNPADAEGLKQQFADLKSQGVLGITAVREFLAKNQDVSFSSFPELSAVLGFPSLRLAFLDVLQATSGTEVVSAATETLRNTGDPTEIATLASILEKNEPGEHRVEAVKAAADSLALAGSGQLADRRVAPAFEVLQTYGDTNVVPLLRDQFKGPWAQNAAVALAELPDGAGIPALVTMLTDPTSGANAQNAYRPLAQVAARYPQAFDALLDQARQGKIPDSEWPGIASALAASDYVSNGSILPDTRSPAIDLHEMLPQRLELINRLAASGDLSHAAWAALQQQRGQLMARIASH